MKSVYTKVGQRFDKSDNLHPDFFNKIVIEEQMYRDFLFQFNHKFEGGWKRSINILKKLTDRNINGNIADVFDEILYKIALEEIVENKSVDRYVGLLHSSAIHLGFQIPENIYVMRKESDDKYFVRLVQFMFSLNRNFTLFENMGLSVPLINMMFAEQLFNQKPTFTEPTVLFSDDESSYAIH